MLIAQISDCHVVAEGERGLRGVGDAAANLARCVAHLCDFDPTPDIVLATGDLTHSGSPAAYARLAELLAPLPMPVYLIPGNHDDRANLRAGFAGHGYLPDDGEFLHYTVEDTPLRLIGLDTVVAGENGGLICAARRAWLDARLAEAPGRPTLVFMHHPPIEIGVAAMDAMGLEGAAEMGAVIARHGQVERIVCGHVHRPVQARWHGTAVATAPSTAAQLELALGEEKRPEFLSGPPAWLMHLWQPGRPLVSHLCVAGE